VTVDLDLLNTVQIINAFGDRLQLGGVIENFIGSAFNDVIRLGALAVPRNVQGHTQVGGLAPGDSLRFATPNGIDDGDSISVPGLADVNYAGIEQVVLDAPPPNRGNIIAKLTSGKLTLTGDAGDNQVKIELAPGGAANKVRVTPLDGTRLNGLTTAKLFSGVTKGLVAALKGGNDLFDLIGGRISGTVTLNGAEGNDTYRVKVASTQVVKILDVEGSDGVDLSQMNRAVWVDLSGATPHTRFFKPDLPELGDRYFLQLPPGIEKVFGTPFDDVLLGNKNANVLVGNGGDDYLFGDGGRDVLIGGDGADTIDGGLGADLVIGGRTIYDADRIALAAILAEWSSPRDRPTRERNLRDGSGSADRLNGDVFLVAGTTVFPKDLFDQVFTERGDWELV
jgi:Ca2+-binding RTX toxin-like protein